MSSLRLRNSTLESPAQPYIGVSTPRSGSYNESSPKNDTQTTHKTETPRLTLEWRSLQLEVPMQNPQTKEPQQKVILEAMSGVARPGELLVVMGPSGAGKSSLLDCVSGRNTAIQGRVTVNGSPWSKELKRFAAYVMQEDLFHATLTCPTFMNPADYFMEKIVVVDADTDEAGVERVRALKHAWKDQHNSAIEVVNPQDVNSSGNVASPASSSTETLNFEDSRASVWGQIHVLATRNALRLLRDKTALRLQSVQTLVTTLLVGIIFFQLTLDQQGVSNFSGAFFYIVTEQVYGASMPAIMSVPMELPIVYREYDIGIYSVASWYAAKNLCELPQQIVLPIISLLPLYFLVGIGHDFSMYIQMQVVMILLHSSCVAFGYCISCVCRRIDIAPLAGNIVLMPLLLLGGLFIDPSDVPGVLRWVQYITPFRYGYYGLMRVFWRRVDEISCDDVAVGETCTARTGLDVLANKGISNRSVASDLWFLLALSVGFRVIGYVALAINVGKRK
ncbi:ABC transporter ATP-binding protein/permease wht-1 [Phytophthora ramorum]|uniref:ABC transporter ATP-binding protein/permease wht-1 n=1 Tax=Phytophthora ramorum TaxID=164328 RepID=UPI00309AEF0E|nr:ABC transporter ATP-binding protein/permease wht-1 [Phytophthora ramorum]